VAPARINPEISCHLCDALIAVPPAWDSGNPTQKPQHAEKIFEIPAKPMKGYTQLQYPKADP
jgi:hypothetical protein